MAQLDMFAGNVPAQPSAAADPDRVRRKLDALLAEAREAGPQGLPIVRRRFMETVVPQMTRWGCPRTRPSASGGRSGKRWRPERMGRTLG